MDAEQLVLSEVEIDVVGAGSIKRSKLAAEQNPHSRCASSVSKLFVNRYTVIHMLLMVIHGEIQFF